MVGQLYQRPISKNAPIWEVTAVDGIWAHVKSGDFNTRLPLSVLKLWYQPVMKGG